jgi:hypothetical protein
MSTDKYEHLVRTEINFAEGIWTLTSSDLPGLLLSHEELETVVDDTPAAIQLLFELNYGLKVKVFALQPAGELARERTRPNTPPSYFAAERMAA